MSRQYFDDLPNEPLAIANSVVNFLTAELALFPNVSQIAIPTADVRPGKIWRLTAGGIWTPPATGTLTITPRWGTTTSGITLGASGAQTLAVGAAASQWWLQGLLMCRAVGLSGLFSTFIAQGLFSGQGAVGTAGSAIQVAFGGTQTAVGDPTLGGFFIGMTFSTTGATMTPQIVALQSMN
jgi:hypothetical protein